MESADKKFKKRSGKDLACYVVQIILYVIMAVVALSLTVPLVWMVINSFKGYIEYYQTQPFEFASKFSFDNYTYAIEHLNLTLSTSKGIFRYNFWSMIGYSFIYAAGSSFLNVFLSACCAYVISKYKFVGRELIYAIGIVVMALPIIGAFPSAMVIRRALGVYDNVLLTILTGPSTAFSGMVFLILYAAFKAIPWDYAEAVFIDGGGHFKVFTQIMLPLIVPTCAVLFILGFIGNWNDYESFLIWMPSTANLAYGMFYYQEYSSATGATAPSILAGFVIVAIPTSALYLASQKLVNSKFTVGGLKG